MAPARLMLLDTASLYFRAFYGVPDSVRAPDGRPVNAVRGLLDFIARLVGEYRPDRLACCWDNDWRPRWRVALIGSYKAHRVAAEPDPAGRLLSRPAGAGSRGAESAEVEQAPDALAEQVPLIMDVLSALGIPVVGHDGYEADDVIGTLAARADGPVDVVTGDRDLFQVVDDRRAVRVLYVARGVGRHERVDDAWIRAKYGVPAAAYVDFATLRGDPSDGLPGVPGIGEKSAAALLDRFTSLSRLRTAAADGEPGIAPALRRRLIEAADYLDVAPRVVAVATDLDLPPVPLARPVAPAHPDRWQALVAELGLGGSAERIVDALASSSPSSP